MDKRLKFFGAVLGIYACFFCFGVLQEKITRGKYGKGENEEKFTYMLSLVLVQCIINYLFAKLLLATIVKQGEDTVKTFYYAVNGLTHVLAMLSSNMALLWVSYPAQVIAKSGKPIPVLVLGVLIGRKSYPVRKYLFVLMIVVGIIIFMYKDSKPMQQSSTSAFGLGELLLALSLIMDGLVGAIQDRMRAEYNVKSGHLMLNINFWCVIYLTIAVLLTGEIIDVAGFVGRHPVILWQVALLALAGAAGQFFIVMTVADFGPLAASIVTTSRKFFTILGSVLIFGNKLLPRQWIAAGVVFTGLGLDGVYGKSPSKKK